MSYLIDSFFGSETEPARHCFLRTELLRQYAEDERLLTLLASELNVPGKPQAMKSLDAKEKFKLITKQIAHLTSTKSSPWHKVDDREVFAAAIWKVKVPKDAAGREALNSVRAESALLQPCREWLSTEGYEPHNEVPMGTARVDVLGYRRSTMMGLRPERVVAIELKNERAQLKRGLDQMTTYALYAHETYLACTPAFAADYLWYHVQSRAVQAWDAFLLRKKLESFGFGLLLVEGTQVYNVIQARRRACEASKLNEIKAVIDNGNR